MIRFEFTADELAIINAAFEEWWDRETKILPGLNKSTMYQFAAKAGVMVGFAAHRDKLHKTAKET